jgi:wyosine [tRNA(Phe)-imidazoG37] synthetase (radical SAM superfamily)
MLIEMPDERLARILPEKEYLSLKARVEEAYAKIERSANEKVLGDVLDLLVILREIEMRLIEDRLRQEYSYVSKAPVA